jgi:hypothetical protein
MRKIKSALWLITKLAAISVALWIIVPALREWVQPARDAGIRMIHAKADSHELKRVADSEKPLDDTVGKDDAVFAEKLITFGTEDGARRNVRYAAEARARGMVPQGPDLTVLGRQDDWKSFNIPVYEPIRIQAKGMIQSSIIDPEKYGPDGTYERGLPPVHQNGKFMVVPSLPFGALIGRVCNNGICGRPFFLGSDGIVCPEVHGSGDLELWTNGFAGQGHYDSREYFRFNWGGFYFTVDTKGASAKCNSFATAR